MSQITLLSDVLQNQSFLNNFNDVNFKIQAKSTMYQTIAQIAKQEILNMYIIEENV